jgi:hypothetical protein
MQQAAHRDLLALPPYVRGEGSYEFWLSPQQREKGMGYLGTRQRLKAALQKLRDGTAGFPVGCMQVAWARMGPTMGPALFERRQ